MIIPDIPALRQPEIVSTDRDLGPKVPTIFVIAGKKLYIHIHTHIIRYLHASNIQANQINTNTIRC